METILAMAFSGNCWVKLYVNGSLLGFRAQWHLLFQKIKARSIDHQQDGPHDEAAAQLSGHAHVLFFENIFQPGNNDTDQENGYHETR